MSSNEVSSAVLSIVAAFSSGVDVLQKLRDKNKKSRVWGKPVSENKAESQLLYSLKQGQLDIHNEYAAGVQAFGQRFATGDLHTQAILTRTLLKLNSGLVDIISSFLSSHKKAPNFDFKSLTHISDASRAEALYSLGELRWRLSQQASQRTHQPLTSHDKPSNQASKKVPIRPKKSVQVGSKSGGSIIARVPIKDSNETQWAIVRRPKNRSTGSSSSMSSNASSLSNASKASTASTALSTLESMPVLLSGNGSTAYSQTALPQSPTRQEQFVVRQNQSYHPPVYSDLNTQQHLLTPDNQPVPVRRRQAKLTPSVYTFKSDSTKIGEIPMQKWIEPFDFEAMERTNAWAEAEGWPANQHRANTGKRPKPRLLQRMFMRSVGNGA